MIENLLNYFSGHGPLEFDKSGDPSDETLKVATAALLWEACLADNELDELEADKLAEIMRNAFQISDQEVEIISSICQSGSSTEKIGEFVNLVNENFDSVQRSKIVEYAGEIARASHGVNIVEGLVCDLMRARLKLTD